MGKIPVTATVSQAYGFLLGEIGTILRLTWAPLLLGSALSYIYGPQIMDATIAAAKNPAAGAQAAPAQLLIGLVGFVTGIIASVALLRVMIFGDRKPGLFVYLWMGGAEFRLIAVSLLLFVAIIAATIGAGLVFALLAVLAAAAPVMSILLFAALVTLLFVAVWAPLRLSLIAPVVVAENTLGVERSWSLMKGNALAMLLVLLLTFLPYLIVSWLVFVAVLGSDFPALPAFPNFAEAGATKSEAAAKAAAEAFQAAMTEWQVSFAKGVKAHLPEITVLGFIGNVISTALWAGVTGGAYNAIVGEKRQ